MLTICAKLGLDPDVKMLKCVPCQTLVDIMDLVM